MDVPILNSSGWVARAAAIIKQLERINQKAIELRRLQQRKLAAYPPDAARAPLIYAESCAKFSNDGHVR